MVNEKLINKDYAETVAWCLLHISQMDDLSKIRHHLIRLANKLNPIDLEKSLILLSPTQEKESENK